MVRFALLRPFLTGFADFIAFFAIVIPSFQKRAPRLLLQVFSRLFFLYYIVVVLLPPLSQAGTKNKTLQNTRTAKREKQAFTS
jgi:hypothetical protein